MSEKKLLDIRRSIKHNQEDLEFFLKDVESWKDTLGKSSNRPLTLEDHIYEKFFQVDETAGDKLISQFISRGKEFFQKGKWTAALSCFTSAIDGSGGMPFCYCIRAACHYKTRRYDLAERDASTAIYKYPEYVRAYLIRGAARKMLGKYTAACGDFLKVLEHEPDSELVASEYEALVSYAKNEEDCDDDKTVLAEREKHLGNRLMSQNRWKEAEEKYSTAIDLDSKNSVYYANRAVCRLRGNRLTLAEEDCSTALDLNENYVKVYIRRGRIRKKLGNLEGAQLDFCRALELGASRETIEGDLSKIENGENDRVHYTDSFLQEKIPRELRFKIKEIFPSLKRSGQEASPVRLPVKTNTSACVKHWYELM